MSLLSTPTARPERVFSLCSLVVAMDGRVKLSDATEWLAPKYRSADGTTQKDQDRVREVFRVARDLGLLEAENDNWVRTCELPMTRRNFAHHVHTHLLGLPIHDPDAVLLRAYAWCVGFIQEHGTLALMDLGAGEMASKIAASLGKIKETDEERVFNTTKLTAWKDWMVFLGLGWNDLPGVNGFLPDPSRRIIEELPTLTLGQSRMEGEAFMMAISRAMPYLDGGDLFTEACNSQGVHHPQGQVSLLLSNALRTLHENGTFKLVFVSDAKKGVNLPKDSLSDVSIFSYVEFSVESPHV